MDTKFIESIHHQPGKFVIAAAGGGTSAISQLQSVPGASNSLLHAHVPYHEKALTGFLGEKPEQSCSSKTARAMAMVTWLQARHLAPEEPVFGIGCTAALVTDRARRGDDRCHIAVQSRGMTLVLSVVFDKTGRTRSEEEAICGDLVLALMGKVVGIEIDWPEGIRDSDVVSTEEVVARPEWTALLTGESSCSLRGGRPEMLFPGAFNPLHAGHETMAVQAEQLTGFQATLEISVFNVDKPPLDFLEMERRLDALSGWNLVYTHAPTFVEKCRLFPGIPLIVGIDTLKRIADKRYYGDDQQVLDRAIREIREHENTFLVFGREIEGRFTTLTDLSLPPVLREICTAVPEESFRHDISSTELRAAGQEPG